MNKSLIFLLIAILGVACFILTGYYIAERSPWGVLLSTIGALLIIGFGFMLKRRWSS